MTGKKAKGRPKGTEKNDDAVLSAVADMMVADATLLPTTAMRRFNKNVTPSELRRWQTKWKERKATYLAEARRLQAEAKTPKGAERRSASARSSIAANLGHLAMLLDTPAMRMARGLDLSPAMKATKLCHESSIMKLIWQMENSAAFRFARDLQKSRGGQLMRQVNWMRRNGYP